MWGYNSLSVLRFAGSLPCYVQRSIGERKLAWELMEKAVSLQANFDIPKTRVYFIAPFRDWYLV